MTPAEFASGISKKGPAPAYLFIGPDYYTRRQVRETLIDSVLGKDDRDAGITRLDLEEQSVAEILDDASSLSLFASRRVILVSNAEAALPRRLSSKETEDGAGALLASYVRNPTPDTVIVFDCLRYGLDGDDKPKVERLRKFYSAIPIVEFASFSVSEAAKLARDLAKQHGLALTSSQVEMLVEALAADAGRISVEIEKLALFAAGRSLSDADLTSLIPNARAASIFSLVTALAKSDRRDALDVLDTLVREGEYLPLVLTFLGTQFRLAIAAADAGARNAGQIQAHFSKSGVAMWRARAEQLAETVRVFPAQKLKRALQLTFEADRALRDTRPDDRTVMEAFVWKLTA